MKRGVLILAAVTLALGALGGCSPKPGGSCKIELKEVCVDEKSALACHDGKWEEMTCRGPGGCSSAGGAHPCDQSGAQGGDACNLVDHHVCSADKRAMLECKNNKWAVVQSCLGERGCAEEPNLVRCDNSIATAGDACREEPDYACTADKKAVLACKGGQFVQSRLCRGPNGCAVVGAKDKGFTVACDDSVAAVGDPCEKDGHYSCSSDGRAVLACAGGKFTSDERCRSKEKCEIRGGQVGCY